VLSIGWVMFWKAVVIAVWIALVARYRAMKTRRREKGVTLVFDTRRGVYLDPLERWEGRVKVAVYALGGLFCLYAAFVLYVILTA
jgi:hypothetical protein